MCPFHVQQILRLCVLAQAGRALISGLRSPLEMGVSAGASSSAMSGSGLRVSESPGPVPAGLRGAVELGSGAVSVRKDAALAALRLGEHVPRHVMLIT